ncbi:GNAT family N-acetyltransferase [Alicyclobacillus vulcanalis]|uniref:L-amino acid N-acyltransferase YncA n=1 Tax=Alicyclobacillus vulcanalis TaxID=252246 RepID=A0A1N7MPA5_9BACL|nr:GNAT family N-acetyltransferase [Alicyclobacillus vulcanalis]SIS87880.1 L-amino acid N-acyltransferase YncA [Alicyclobacillus vulcanalis]
MKLGVSVIIQIREMKQSDLSTIARVNVEVFRETHRGIVPQAFIADLSYERAEQRFRRMLAKKERKAALFVAEDGYSIIGYAMGGLAREKVQDFDSELYGIYILPTHHGMGVGRNLVSAIAKYLKEHNAHSMFVVVFSDNMSARNFYQALGGQKVYVRTIELCGENIQEVIYGWSSLDGLFHK